MNVLLRPFIALSAVGLILSLIVHVSALVGYDLGFGQSVFALHMGIFVVWLPTVLVAIRTTGDFRRRDFWKAALRGCPDWMRKMTYGFFGYAIVNFAIFMFTTITHPGSHSGEPTPAVLRGFSGHWMAFYSAAMAVLYSATKVKETDAGRRCRNGHPVSPLAKYCEECGSPVSSQ